MKAAKTTGSRNEDIHVVGSARGGALSERRRVVAHAAVRAAAFLRRLLAKPTNMVAAAILFLALVTSIFAHLIAPYDPLELHLEDRMAGPSLRYLMGTDETGRDLLSNLLYAGRVSLLAGVAAEAIAILVGLPIGLAGGFWRGFVDDVLMRVMDGVLAFPDILLALVIVGFFGPSLRNVVLAIGITFVPGVARIVRSAVLQERERDYVMAAQVVGAPGWAIAVRHILPNSFAPLIVHISLGVAVAILIEAGLSFLGLGIQPPKSSWGVLLSEGYGYITRTPWYVTFPGLFIFVTVWSLNVLGDGLRDVLDPRLKGV